MRLMDRMFLYNKALEVKISEKTQLFIKDFYDIKKKELIAEGSLAIMQLHREAGI